MKANELRIGVSVEVFMGNAHPGQWKHHIVSANDIKDGYNKDFRPIPLTEEWLLKLGFVKKEDYDEELGALYELEWWGGFYKKEDYFIPKPYYFADAFCNDFKLRYVHQLQNLYFALTGEELTT